MNLVWCSIACSQEIFNTFTANHMCAEVKIRQVFRYIVCCWNGFRLRVNKNANICVVDIEAKFPMIQFINKIFDVVRLVRCL